MRLACAGFDRGVVYRAPFDLGHARRNTDDHARFGHDGEALMYLANEVVQHQLGDIDVTDDAVFQRTNGDDVGRRTTNHALRVRTDGQRPFGLGIDRDHRGLIDDDALAAYQHERVRRAEIDTNITGKNAHDAVERIAQSKGGLGGGASTNA